MLDILIFYFLVSLSESRISEYPRYLLEATSPFAPHGGDTLVDHGTTVVADHCWGKVLAASESQEDASFRDDLSQEGDFHGGPS